MPPVRRSAASSVTYPAPGAGNPEIHIKELLQAVNAAMRAGDVDRALRYTDRAWRLAREDAQVTLLYARFLAHVGDHAAALRLLAKVPVRDSSAEFEAQIVDCLLAQGDDEAARARLVPALQSFCLEPGGRLAESARRVAERAPAGKGGGWVGITPGLELFGAARGVSLDPRLEIRAEDGTIIASGPIAVRAGERSAFHLKPPPDTRGLLHIAADGVPLLGSGLAFPPDFDLDGRATDRDGHIAGWVRIGWRPSAPVELVFDDGRGATARVASEPDGSTRGRRAFSLDPAAAGLRGNEIFISAVLPDGVMQRLPDAPLLLAKAVPPIAARKEPARARTRPAQRGGKQPVTILVPVYLGREDTRRSLEALLGTLRAGDEVLVIDDASPDTALSADLDALAAAKSITLLRNETNLGFAATVNRGLAACRQRDVILLNADTVVFGDWIDRLQRAARKDPTVGTVTPLTNRGAIASYPGGGESDCTAEEAAALDRLTAAVNPGATIDVPVGVGFCLYLRRDCLDETGPFDAATFGTGYGEENDFCLRASRRQWRHVLAADVFVQHVGGRSFGRRSAALRDRNRRLLNLRHPGYDQQVEAFLAADPARLARRRIDEARLAAARGRHALIVTLGLPGGVERHVRERCRVLRESGLIPLLMRPSESGAGCVITAEDGRYGDLRYDMPGELPALAAMLSGTAFDHVELHHFLDQDPRVIEAVLTSGVPYDVYVHDYIWICPRVGLVDGTGRYCGEPNVSACELCVKANGSSLHEPISVRDLRRRSARWLAGAREVIVPSNDVAMRLARYFPRLAPRIAAWEEKPTPVLPPAPRPGPVRVALIGAIGEHKGFRLLLDCARDAAARNLPLEFVVLGYSEDDEALLKSGKVFVSGRYEEDELPDLLRRERPNLVFFPSVTPETWCFALTEALRSGVPIAALAHGAIAERLRAADTGVLIPVDADAREINGRLLTAAGATAEATRHVAEQNPAFASPLRSPNLAADAAQEIQHMDKTGPSSAKTDIPLSGSVEVINIPKGRYRFAVKTGAPSRSTGAANLTVPAIHVGLGPGVSPKAATLEPKKRGNGNWLFEAGDALVAKVAGPGATLVLTSVRAPGGQALAIEVERLDAKEAPQPMMLSRGAARPAVASAGAGTGLRTEIVAHVRHRGDLAFVDADWAGRVAPGLWIEAFTVRPLEGIDAADIECKGLTRTGIETPWTAGGTLCGTRGMSVALIGFAVRLKPGSKAAYDCEYSGHFQSGTVVGPLRNGAPCRSTVPNDPLEGIQLRIIARPTDKKAATEEPRRGAPPVGPRFSKFREEIAPAPPEHRPAPAADKPDKAAARKAAAPARPGKPAQLRKRGPAQRRHAAP